MTDDELKQARLEKAREIYADTVCGKQLSRWRAQIVAGEYDTYHPVIAALAALELCNWQPPVDPDLKIAREAVAQIWDEIDSPIIVAGLRAGKHDSWSEVIAALAAIKLYKSRMGA